MNRKPAHPNRSARGYAALTLVAISALGVAPPAWAYLDPGTGSMIISAVVGLVATVGLAVKTYWYKIKAFLRKDASSPRSTAGPAAGERPREPADEPERSTES
ncbi:MAG: hypothetical protein E2O52_07160 [Gammaproteobacteria bacterium]|nr:MAG: hypothetical protein E2O52_07160 [Gammaproteobacteria bacterium]